MEKIKILKTIQKLLKIDIKEFILQEEYNIIYISYGVTPSQLEDAYHQSAEIVEIFDKDVIFNFNGYDILVNESTKMKDVLLQYKKAHEFEYKGYVEQEFKKAVKNLNIKNAKRKTREVYRLIKDERGFRNYITNYQISNLSNALINGYKNTLPDQYLDSMVEEVKIFKKK